LQSIENITLESLQDSNGTEQRTKGVYHFAIKQTGVSLDFHLEQFFQERRISFHHFNSFKELASICHRHQVSAIFIGGINDFLKEIDLVRTIKNNILLSIIPVILYHPEPDTATVVAAFENGAEDFIYGEWVAKLVEARITKSIERSVRDLSVNPSTLLPGPTTIEREINNQLQRKERFAICYADLDNFKAYNDFYGYVYGDKVIRLTGRILRDVVFDLCPEGFVGHIAGDDFLLVVPEGEAERVCKWIIRSFDALIQCRYEPEDLQRGYVETRSRRGTMQRYPLLSISIAVVINKNGEFKHIGELSKMLADLKKATKSKPGSNYMIERRKKY